MQRAVSQTSLTVIERRIKIAKIYTCIFGREATRETTKTNFFLEPENERKATRFAEFLASIGACFSAPAFTCLTLSQLRWLTERILALAVADEAVTSSARRWRWGFGWWLRRRLWVRLGRRLGRRLRGWLRIWLRRRLRIWLRGWLRIWLRWWSATSSYRNNYILYESIARSA
ncbi:hypothetical protein A3D88_02090 [Candidatus Peribacteria bacterium RIFCSPHIGHO2_02_FULL_52_16]|nr:MAG: hypothetical protein A2706_02870 [Candidatus Peribacteria bacterium RIFCSPHIGHO2_01_FULL_51_35]OGJ61415.1 MAG: hypothetical protein A3D88_02090 [Candidatus Peribacteria bacterium RIFCSPHIGHO2_02_FULL_52_16]